jgi:hypothetical protein
MHPSVTLAISIARAPAEVAAFVADVTQLPRWAGGLCKSARQQGGQWRLDSGQGEVGFRFTGNTAEGILDHLVTLPDGVHVRIPLRVVPNEAGSEVLFTLFRLPDMTDERLRQDMAKVQADLQQLKQVLEGASMSPP